MRIIKNEICEIEIESNPRNLHQRANHYFGVKLLSGKFPDPKTLIVACDNGEFGLPDRTFGGDVQMTGSTTAYVTVYVD